MEALLLAIAAGLASAALLASRRRSQRPQAIASPLRARLAGRVLGATLAAAVVVPIGLAAVLAVLRPGDAPLRFVHGCLVLGFWMAATVLGVGAAAANGQGAPGRAAVASTAAVAALVAAGAAVFVTPYDRFALAFPGPAALLAAALAVLLVGAASTAATHGLRVARSGAVTAGGAGDSAGSAAAV